MVYYTTNGTIKNIWISITLELDNGNVTDKEIHILETFVIPT
jgi:hypothetical protein